MLTGSLTEEQNHLEVMKFNRNIEFVLTASLFEHNNVEVQSTPESDPGPTALLGGTYLYREKIKWPPATSIHCSGEISSPF